MGERGWTNEGYECEIEFERCLAGHDSASRTFQRITFEEPTACGDCIIRALVNKSGKRGLKAFLPSSSSSKNPNAATAHTPTLPISSKWQDADFRLSSVLKSANLDQVNIRDVVLRMLQKYRFVLGKSSLIPF
ncbi:Xanthine phosphoribosyltransferase 1 [Ceratobasidium sp. 392]|nr:Xanthine phosphoribosyltransferase 1 [Ceratobasidium sp. 392]